MSLYANNILVTFDMLLDTDIGLFNTIKSSYNDPNIFDNSILNLSNKYRLGLLRENITGNPIDLLLINKDIVGQSKSFYDEFIDTEYKNILQKSIETTIVTVVKRFIDSEASIYPTILCETKLEYDIVLDIFSDCVPDMFEVLIEKDFSKVNMKIYDSIFTKKIDTLLKFNQETITGKNIVISDYRCNLDETMYKELQRIPKGEFILLYSEQNEFRTITLYYYDESYYKD